MAEKPNGRERVLQFMRENHDIRFVSQKIADTVGLYVNTTNKWLNDLRNKPPHYPIRNETVKGKAYDEYWYDSRHPLTDEEKLLNRLKALIDIVPGAAPDEIYPEWHPQYAAIKEQIRDMEIVVARQQKEIADELHYVAV